LFFFTLACAASRSTEPSTATQQEKWKFVAAPLQKMKNTFPEVNWNVAEKLI